MSSPTLPAALQTAPPTVPNVLISFPAPHVLLVTLNRPKQLNAIPSTQHAALASLWDWYDAEPHLRAAVLTGSGRAFCAGADLREWDRVNSSSSSPSSGDTTAAAEKIAMPPAGFGGMSNRPGRKPIIAAVNGLCYGGGFEIIVNCDIILAGKDAKFGLPEVTIGVVALAGALPRLAGIVGRQRASEMVLLGRTGYSAETMRERGVVNFVVGEGEGEVVSEAVKVAREMAERCSPDAVIVSREGLRLGGEGLSPERAVEVLAQGWYGRIDKGENMREGVRSFVERRAPVWVDSKL